MAIAEIQGIVVHEIMLKRDARVLLNGRSAMVVRFLLGTNMKTSMFKKYLSNTNHLNHIEMPKLHFPVFLLLVLLFLPCFICSAQTISGGRTHAFFICNGGNLRSWGYNNYGELGNGNYTDTNVPVWASNPSLINIADVSAAENYTLVLKDDSTVWGVGQNNHGQIGIGSFVGSTLTTQVHGPGNVGFLTGITAIATGFGHAVALKSDGTVWTWGFNMYGQIGNGTNTNCNVPVLVSSLSGIVSIGAGLHQSFAIKNDGTVWVWGCNNMGQLGLGNLTNSNIPIQNTLLTSIVAIAGGWRHGIALKNDGTVLAWGVNQYGQLGNGNFVDSSVPVPVNGLTGIIAIDCGHHHSLALKSDSIIWSWGHNNWGQLGDGTYVDRNLPVPVNVLTQVTEFSAGGYFSLAIKINGTAWSWGENNEGELGNGHNTAVNNPGQITGLCQPITTGIGQDSSPAKVSVFPNPSNGTFQLNFENKLRENGEVEIYNLLGEIIFTSAINDSVSTIDLTGQPGGIYFINIHAGTETVTQKIIIQK
jgi:alpha-tubulin suppressor-like RCC1 family protein